MILFEHNFSERRLSHIVDMFFPDFQLEVALWNEPEMKDGVLQFSFYDAQYDNCSTEILSRSIGTTLKMMFTKYECVPYRDKLVSCKGKSYTIKNVSTSKHSVEGLMSTTLFVAPSGS